MNVREIIENERLNIIKSIADKEKLLATLPEGSLQVHRRGNTFNWYRAFAKAEVKCDDDGAASAKAEVKCDDDGTAATKICRKYISRDNRDVAETLAYKGYVKARLQDEYANLKAADYFLKNYKGCEFRNKYIAENEGRRELLMPRLHISDMEIDKWMRDIFTGEVPEKQNLRYMSQAGFLVRSKSEQIIVALLMKYDLPFKYEQHFFINNNNWYPDFMVMHPKTHKVYVWEHLGMMDKYNYREHNWKKINDYCILGFVPGDNLILTYETEKSGIDEHLAEKLIQHYFT